NQLDHLDAMFHATADSVAMRPRSSHRLFTNLPDPRPTLGDRVSVLLQRGCAGRLKNLPHFPAMEPGPSGPSKLLEHVIAQLLFTPIYKPVVAQCEEVIIHWGAPADACTQLADKPDAFLAEQDALAPVLDVLAWRGRKAELDRLGWKQPGELP